MVRNFGSLLEVLLNGLEVCSIVGNVVRWLGTLLDCWEHCEMVGNFTMCL